MKIFLIGGGEKVWSLLKDLMKKKRHQITVINKNLDLCRSLAKRFTHVYIHHGEGTMPSVLKETALSKADIVVALSSRDAENLIVCGLAKKVFKVSQTAALVNYPQNVEVFLKLGVDRVISTGTLINSLIEEVDGS